MSHEQNSKQNSFSYRGKWKLPMQITLKTHLSQSESQYSNDIQKDLHILIQSLTDTFDTIGNLLQSEFDYQSNLSQSVEIFKRKQAELQMYVGLYSTKTNQIFRCQEGKYVILFNALQGTQEDNQFGTFFAICQRVSPPNKQITMDDVYQVCQQFLVAGYCNYGPSRQLVLAIGAKVNIYTYLPEDNQYFLSHTSIKIPNQGQILSYDSSNYPLFDERIKTYINQKKLSLQNEEGFSGCFRYVGNLVADVHRTLIYGGILLIPPLQQNSKTQLKQNNQNLIGIVDAMILSFIFEMAWGRSTTIDKGCLMNKKLSKLDQKTSLFLGSASEVVFLENILLSHSVKKFSTVIVRGVVQESENECEQELEKSDS